MEEEEEEPEEEEEKEERSTSSLIILTLPAHPNFFLHLSQLGPCQPLSQLKDVAENSFS